MLEDPIRQASRELLNPQSEDWQEEVESREYPPSSMMTQGMSSRVSSKESFVMPLPIPSTPRERQSPPWTSCTHSRDKEEPSMDLEVEQYCFKIN